MQLVKKFSKINNSLVTFGKKKRTISHCVELESVIDRVVIIVSIVFFVRNIELKSSCLVCALLKESRRILRTEAEGSFRV